MEICSDDVLAEDHLAQGAEAEAIRRHRGLRNVDDMTDAQLLDLRLTNKRANQRVLAGLDDFGISPGFLHHCQVWFNRYQDTLESTYPRSDPRHSVETVPTAETITLMLRVWAVKAKSHQVGPNGERLPILLRYLKSGLLGLFYRFRTLHPLLKLTKADVTAIKSTFRDLVRQNLVRLESGKVRPSLPLMSAIVLVRRYLVSALLEGVRSVDALLNNILLFVTLCTTGARAGDITSAGRGTAHMSFRDVQLWLDGSSSPATWASVRGRLTIKWYKGNRQLTRPPQVHDLSTLSLQAPMDALVWLIVYLRRVGMLKGSTSEMLAIASKRPDRRIVLEPPVGRSLDDPLFVHVEPAGSYHTPSPPAATGDSVRRAINTLAVKGGALTRPGAHSLRRGLARDVSKLAASELSTGAGPHVATILGHSDKSTREKLGDHYAGASIENLMNIRAGKLPDNVAPPSATTTSLRYPVGPSLPFPIRSEAPDRLAEQNRKLLRDKLLSLPAWQHKEHSGDSKQHRYQLNMEIDRIEAAAHANGVPLLLYFESSVLGTEINSMDVQISDATVAETDGVDDEFLEQHNIGTGVELSRAAHADVDLAMDIAVNELGAGQAINFKSVQQMMLYEGDGKPVPQDVLSFSGDQLADYFAAYNVIHEPVDWAASAKRPLIEQHLSSRHNGFGRDDLTFFRAFCQQGCGQQGLRVDDVIPELHNCPKKAKTVSDEPIWPTSVAVDASRLETAAMPRIPSKRELSTFDSPQQSPVNSPALRVDSLGKLPQRPVDFRRAQSFSWGVVKQTPVAPNLGESASSSQNVIGQSYVIRDPAGQEAAEHIAPVGTAEFQPRTVWPVPPGWPRPSRCLLHATTGCNFSWSEKSQFVRHATSKVHRLTRADVDTMVANAYNAFIADPHSATPLTAVAAIPVRRTLPRVHAAYWAEMPCPITGCGSKLKGPTLKGILKHLQAERPRGKHALSEAQALKAVEEMFTSFGQTDDTA